MSLIVKGYDFLSEHFAEREGNILCHCAQFNYSAEELFASGFDLTIEQAV